MVCYPSVGGSGVLASSLGQGLAERGHEVHFVTYRPPVRLDLSAPNLFFHRVPVTDQAVFPVPDYTLPLAVKLAEVHQTARLDVLHVHYAVPHATAALQARAMVGHGPPLVTTLHGTDVSLLGRDPGYAPAIAQALDRSEAVTAVSQSLADETVACFGTARPQVIYNFAQLPPPTRTRAEVRRELGVGEAPLLLHMSNLRPVKRVDLVIEAFQALEQPAHLLILAGGDPSHLRVGEGITVLTGQPVPDYIQACDCGLYASERESFGLAVLETMLGGRPVVATRVGGLPEVVEDGITGLLCQVGKVAELASALRLLVADGRRRRAMGQAARQRALRHFARERALEAYLDVYRQVTR